MVSASYPESKLSSLFVEGINRSGAEDQRLEGEGEGEGERSYEDCLGESGGPLTYAFQGSLAVVY